MPIEYDGKKEAEKILDKVRNQLSEIQIKPSLAIIRIGEGESKTKFTNVKKKTAETLGLRCEIIEVEEDSTVDQIKELLSDLSAEFSGILVQLPIPNHLDRYELFNSIPLDKDVEQVSISNVGRYLQGTPEIYSPFAKAIVHAAESGLSQLGIDPTGKKVTIVGNSYLAGKPVGQIMYNNGCTVTLCGSRTEDLTKHTSESDIVVSCTGVASIITPEMVKKDSILIDAGFEVGDDGVVSGDFDPGCFGKSAFYTPVPGGIGPLTVAYIFDNLVRMNL